MNEILVIRHYGVEDIAFNYEYDTEIYLNGVLVANSNYYNSIDDYLEGFREAIKLTHVFHSYKEQNVNDAPHWD